MDTSTASRTLKSDTAMTSMVFNNSLMTTTTTANTTEVQDSSLSKNMTLASDTDPEDEGDHQKDLQKHKRDKTSLVSKTEGLQLNPLSEPNNKSDNCHQVNKDDEQVEDNKNNEEESVNRVRKSEGKGTPLLIDHPTGERPLPNNNPAKDTPILSDLPLQGTTLFVDVRAENENRSKAVSREVEKLGGVVVGKINSQVTHVVYKEGRNATLLQLRRFPDVHLVSVLWVDACKTTGTRVDEGLYAVKFSDGASSPFPAKARRVKSLQPKTMEDDVNNSGKKAERRRKRLRTQGKSTGDTPPDDVICLDSGDEEYLKSSDLYKLVATPKVIPDTPWMLNYVYSKDATPGTQDREEKSAANGDTSFTGIVNHNSPGRRRRFSNSSVLSTGTLPRRLSRDLEESNESFEIISPTQKFNETNDSDVISPTQKTSDRKGNNNKSLDSRLSAHDGNMLCTMDKVDNLSNPEEQFLVEGNGQVLNIPKKGTPPQPSVLKEISVIDNQQAIKKKRRKKLLSASELVPFTDSPLADDDTNGLRLEPVQYQKNIPKRSFMNASLAINNVESSKLLLEAKNRNLKKQRKKFLLPFPSEEVESPNGSFKTKEHLQLRAPNRKKKNKAATNSTENSQDGESENNENIDASRKICNGKEGETCVDLVDDMRELQVTGTVTEDEEDNQEDDKENTAMSSGRSRRSSAIDFKITKKFRKISLKDKNKRKVQPFTNYNEDGRIFSSPSSVDENSEDDTESVDSNVSFIHDEKEGLIILSQEDSTPLRHNNLNNNHYHHDNYNHRNNDKHNDRPPRKDANADSGISDGEENIDQEKRNCTRKKLRSSTDRVGKSPKVCSSRSTRRIVSPYNSLKARSSLVSTSLHLSEQTFLKAMLKKLGGFVYRSGVVNDTTHVIAGSERRTLNILYAIVYGCWILDPKWVSDSVEEGKWLKETDYEMSKEFPLAKKARVSRSKHGKSLLGTLFSSLPPIYVSDTTSPPSHELTRLINLCGGQLTNSVRKAGFGVGTINTRRMDLCTVNEKWVLDCITEGDILPTKDYENFVLAGNSSPGF